jgi:hypothetical protein
MLWIQKHLPFARSVLKRRGYPDFPVQTIEFGDVVAGLPVKPASVEAVYCSHVLEHLALLEFRAALRNVFNYLRPGGRFRMVVPDMQYLVERYLADPRPDAVSELIEASNLGEKNAPKGVHSFPRRLFGHSRHKWMWDYKALEQELSQAGFVDIRRAYFHDSGDAHFNEVEERDRWDHCLGVDCLRPTPDQIEKEVALSEMATPLQTNPERSTVLDGFSRFLPLVLMHPQQAKPRLPLGKMMTLPY